MRIEITFTDHRFYVLEDENSQPSPPVGPSSLGQGTISNGQVFFRQHSFNTSVDCCSTTGESSVKTLFALAWFLYYSGLAMVIDRYWYSYFWIF